MKLFTLTPLIFLCFRLIQPVGNELTDAYWSLVKIENTASNIVSLADTTCGTILHFDNDGKYKGYSGCNSYIGNYIVYDAQKISMDNPNRTKRGCLVCQLGETLFDYYPKTIQYRIQKDTLTFWTDGKIKITFKKTIN